MRDSIGPQSGKRFLTLAIVGMLLAIAMPAWAVTAAEVAKLAAADEAAGDVFGLNVAINTDTILVGAYADDDVPNSSGSAYVFVRNTAGVACAETMTVDPWCQQQKLTAGDAESGEWFG